MQIKFSGDLMDIILYFFKETVYIVIKIQRKNGNKYCAGRFVFFD